MKYLFPILLTIVCAAVYAYLCLAGMGTVGVVGLGFLLGMICISAFCVTDAPRLDKYGYPIQPDEEPGFPTLPAMVYEDELKETAEQFIDRMHAEYKASQARRTTDSTVRVDGQII